MRKLIVIVAGLLLFVGGVGYLVYTKLSRAEHSRPGLAQGNELLRKEKEEKALKEYPLVSLVDRLPKGKPIPPSRLLDADAKGRWEDLDNNLARAQAHDWRTEVLRALHERTRAVFVASSGEGPYRGPPTDEEILTYDFPTMPQPGKAPDFPTSANEPLTRVPPDSGFHSHHADGLAEFFAPDAFGYVKDRTQVAGFRSHGFRDPDRWRADRIQLMPNADRWRVDHIQLIGILVHPQPVVYLTNKMPSMEQVRQGKVRDLDFFEDTALAALREGEDLYIVRKNDTVRMLGAVRATKTCQQCHDAQVGDLLGAFSYTLRPGSGVKSADR
jgi:hypothetical protein